MRTKNELIAIVLLALLGMSSFAFAAEKGLLDGKTFVGTIKKKGQPGDADKLIFKDGKFRSTACEKYGFKEARYVSKRDGAKTRFELDVENAKGAKNHWSGTVDGTKLEGVMTYIADGETTEYLVDASLER